MKSSTTALPSDAPSVACDHKLLPLKTSTIIIQNRKDRLGSTPLGLEHWNWRNMRQTNPHIDGERRKERTCSWKSKRPNCGSHPCQESSYLKGKWTDRRDNVLSLGMKPLVHDIYEVRGIYDDWGRPSPLGNKRFEVFALVVHNTYVKDPLPKVPVHVVAALCFMQLLILFC